MCNEENCTWLNVANRLMNFPGMRISVLYIRVHYIIRMSESWVVVAFIFLFLYFFSSISSSSFAPFSLHIATPLSARHSAFSLIHFHILDSMRGITERERAGKDKLKEQLNTDYTIFVYLRYVCICIAHTWNMGSWKKLCRTQGNYEKAIIIWMKNPLERNFRLYVYCILIKGRNVCSAADRVLCK